MGKEDSGDATRYAHAFLSACLHSLSSLLCRSPRRRGSTIDDFVLKGESNIITFSLPSPAAGIPSMGPGGIVGGFYVLGGAYVTFNGTPQQDTLEFLSGALLSVGAGLILQSPGGQLVLTGPLLYTGGPYSPTFNTGPFNLTNFSDGNPYSLSITAESAAAPEPGTLLLLSTGPDRGGDRRATAN